jgi:hypothetical protein
MANATCDWCSMKTSRTTTSIDLTGHCTIAHHNRANQPHRRPDQTPKNPPRPRQRVRKRCMTSTENPQASSYFRV